ncbi:MAG: bifunctional DNA primase/polymerase [Chloroflexota bacterium]
MALSYRAAGLSVIPVGRDKRPYWSRLPQLPDPKRPGRTKGVWQPFRQQVADEAQLVSWFSDGRANVGLVGGLVSGGLLVLDFDHDAVAIFPAWQQALGALAADLPVVATRKGFHVYLRLPNPGGNRTLAWSEDGRKRIETRGEGGYVLAPPSRHPSGHIYHWLQGDQTTIPAVAAVTAVFTVAAQFNERPQLVCTEMTTFEAFPSPDATLRLQQYAHAVLRREGEGLAKLKQGGRNDGLNRAAFCLGRYVGAGLLSQEAVVAHLHRACQSNGLIADDGQAAFRRTLVSGLDAGIRQAIIPAQLLSRLAA